MQLARLLAPTNSPIRRLRIVAMTDPTERRDHPTDASPPPEAATNPVASMVAIPPPGGVPRLTEEIRDASIDQLLRMYHDARKREHDLLDADGIIAKRADERADRTRRETVKELSSVVDRIAGEPVRDLARKLAGIADEVQRIGKDVQLTARDTRRNAEEIEAMREELSTVREQLAAVTKHVDRLQAQIDRQQSAPTT